MKRFSIGTFLILCFLVSSYRPIIADDGKPPQPLPKDRCPVCGMFVAKYPDFVAVIEFKDSSTAFFDGVKDMFKYYFKMEKYNPSQHIEDIKTIYVTDYYNLELVDGFNSHYIIGSDILGPMGKELIPVEKESEAMDFLNDHFGQEMIKFDDITPEIIKSLD